MKWGYDVKLAFFSLFWNFRSWFLEFSKRCVLAFGIFLGLAQVLLTGLKFALYGISVSCGFISKTSKFQLPSTLFDTSKGCLMSEGIYFSLRYNRLH